jgi:hypothetical protein
MEHTSKYYRKVATRRRTESTNSSIEYRSGQSYSSIHYSVDLQVVITYRKPYYTIYRATRLFGDDYRARAIGIDLQRV